MLTGFIDIKTKLHFTALLLFYFLVNTPTQAIDSESTSPRIAINDLYSINLISFESLNNSAEIQGIALVNGLLTEGSKNINNRNNILIEGQSTTQQNLNGNTSVVDKHIDIIVIQIRHQKLSTLLSTLESTSQVTYPNLDDQQGSVKLIAKPNNNRLAVINIENGNDLFSNNKVESIDVISNNSGAILINVGGENITFNRAIFTGEINSDLVTSRVIWNFYEATNIVFERSFKGTVLAPLASFENRSQVAGSVIAKSIQMKANIGFPLFSGNSILSSIFVDSKVRFKFLASDEVTPENPSGTPPRANELRLSINDEQIPGIGADGILELSLPPGEYDLKAYTDFGAARDIFTISEGESIDATIALNSEYFSGLVDYDTEIVEANDNDIITDSSSFSIRVFSPSGETIPLSKNRAISLSRIETNSFIDSVGSGGRIINRPVIVEDDFEIKDGLLVARSPQDFFNKVRGLGIGEYQLEIWAAGNALEPDFRITFHDVVRFVIGEFSHPKK